MAREELSVDVLSVEGVEPSFVAAAGDGHHFENDEKTILLVKTAAQAVGVTIKTPYEREGLELADRVVTVGENSYMAIGKFDRRIYTQTEGDFEGDVLVDYDETNEVEVAAVRV